MKNLLLIALCLLLSWPGEAQSRTGRYTSYDGVLQVEYPRGWRIGTISPDMESFEDSMQREAPEFYELNLLHSSPTAEIRFLVAIYPGKLEQRPTP